MGTRNNSQPRSSSSYYSKFVSDAKRRRLDVELSQEEHATLVRKPCEYCGVSSNIEAIGVDRVDSAQGYLPHNVVPCCSMCNYVKSDLPIEEFHSHLRSIETHTSDTAKPRAHDPEESKGPVETKPAQGKIAQGASTPKPPATTSRAWSCFTASAKHKGLSVVVSRPEYEMLVLSPTSQCHYCGTRANIGVNRIDKTSGFLPSNTVACCGRCCKMKAKLTKEEFLEQVHKILDHNA